MCSLRSDDASSGRSVSSVVNSSSPLGIVAVILTQDEERHIARAINSVARVCSSVIVVDSGSTDRTVEVAAALGATVYFNPWVNYSTQFNWALKQVPPSAEWVLRLDADEIVTDELADQILSRLANLPEKVSGIVVDRRMAFLGRPIRYGGVFPVKVLRIFRNGQGECEDRWMDEHIKVKGEVIEVVGEILDDNLNTLTWWISKHNSYASREVVDLLNSELRFMAQDEAVELSPGQARTKRLIKEKVYSKLPLGIRAAIYFLYRYVMRFGFLDGREGFAFHFLQGFWYRYLVDLKILEVRRYMARSGSDVRTAIERVLHIRT